VSTGGAPNNNGGKGGLDIGDPGHIFPDDSKGNAVRRAGAGDPFGLYYKPPNRIPSEAELAQQEEERKAALRDRINRLYGIGGPAAAAPSPTGGALMETAPSGDPELDATRKQMGDELTKVGDATRNYYTDQLGRTFTKAERNTRFNLARQGLLGSSEDSNQQGEVRSDRDLGATRVDEAVRKAVAGLTTQREQERLNAINLVNAGVGDSAIDAASSGLRTSFANANNQSKVDLFSDLFANAADAAASQNANAANAALLARYKAAGSFFPAASTTSGRVTPTS
jgi:hypothetical protein